MEGGTTSEIDLEDFTGQLANVLDAFKADILRRVQNDPKQYKKPVKYFIKNMKIVHNSAPKKFIKSMYTFGVVFNFPAQKGKRKNATQIGINNTNKSRRLYKSRGSSAAPKGRPSNAVRPKKRDSETVAHILPTKKRKSKQPRSISKSVAANRPSEKKH